MLTLSCFSETKMCVHRLGCILSDRDGNQNKKMETKVFNQILSTFSWVKTIRTLTLMSMVNI